MSTDPPETDAAKGCKVASADGKPHLLVVMRPQATRADEENIRDSLKACGCGFESVVQKGRAVFIAYRGVDKSEILRKIEHISGIEYLTDVFSPYPWVSREFKSRDTRIPVNGIEIGGSDLVVIVSICNVGTEKVLFETAESLAKAGAKLLQSGGLPIQTHETPDEPVGVAWVRLFAKVGKAAGLPIVAAVTSEEDVKAVAEYADVVQVDSRNMQNFSLLKKIGKCCRPVLLTRGTGCTIKELLLSAEYVTLHGNPDIVLCDRGIRTFENATVNTCDLASVPLLQQLTHLPVIIDARNSTGNGKLVPAVSRAAVAIGADGVAVQIDPGSAGSRNACADTIGVDQFGSMMRMLKPYVALWQHEREQRAS